MPKHVLVFTSFGGFLSRPMLEAFKIYTEDGGKLGDECKTKLESSLDDNCAALKKPDKEPPVFKGDKVTWFKALYLYLSHLYHPLISISFYIYR